MFVNDKKDIVYHQISSKRRVKKLNHQTLAFYMFYRKNLHKFYSQEYSANEINLDELDYLKAQKAYELSVFLDSHKFIKNNKNFDLKFNDLVKRKYSLYTFIRNIWYINQKCFH